MSNLESGHYIINNAGSSIGRYMVEDLSLRPKRIVTLPQGVVPFHWIIEKVNDKYLLKAIGCATGEYDGHVYAFLIDQGRAEHWVFEPVHGQVPNCFAIRTQDGKKGWVAQEASNHGDLKTVKCEPLSGSNGNYPAKEIFQFFHTTF
ncbi:hypothetical protein PM082_019154 [Marasmius tenuissimus]|nr:hypothetical protein PM082_019154 [Marasmius tenuissimus]